jgi:hypothetical protein
LEQSNKALTVYLKQRVELGVDNHHYIHMDSEKNIALQHELIAELEDLLADYEEAFEDDMQVSITLVNYAIKSLMHKSDPLIASEIVSSSLSAWMSFARKMSEEEMSVAVATVAFAETEDAEISPELLFLDVDGVKPN